MSRDELVASLDRVLAGHGWVRLAVLFGSQATGRSGDGSDVDVGITATGDPTLHDELLLQAALEQATGLAVDLVRLDRAPTLLRWYAARDGHLIRQSSPVEWVRYRAAAASEHADFAPALARAAARYSARLIGRGDEAP